MCMCNKSSIYVNFSLVLFEEASYRGIKLLSCAVSFDHQSRDLVHHVYTISVRPFFSQKTAGIIQLRVVGVNIERGR